MPARCPYLRLAEERDEALVAASTDHRCYARIEPERVGLGYQAKMCLTAEHRRCPRLEGSLSPERGAAALALAPRLVTPEQAPRRSLSLTEMVVVGMGLAVVLALLFAGMAVVYRLIARPGLEAAPAVAQGGIPTPAEEESPGDTTPNLPTLTPLPTVGSTPVAPIISPTPSPVPSATPYVRVPATESPSRLVIGKIDLDVPVHPVGVKTIREGGQPKVVWDDLPDAGAFHQTSALPGSAGNTVINGHRDIQGAIFRHLDRVEVGDEIVLYAGDTAYRYVVSEILVVPEVFASAQQRAENLRLIGYMPEERLTLVTCTPVGLATHRLLVVAEPLDPAGPQMPGAGSEPTP